MTAKNAFYVPGMSLATYAVVVDKPWLDALPAAQRKAVVDTIEEISKRQWNEAIEEDKKMIAKMTAQGAIYRVADKAEIERWRKHAEPGSKAFEAKYPDAMRKMNELEARCSAK
jgi:C4-dicarboxylate-binding protein DctP